MTLLEQFWLSGLACVFLCEYVCFLCFTFYEYIMIAFSSVVQEFSRYMFQLYVPGEMVYSPPCLPCDGDCSSEPIRAAPAALAAA